MRRILCCLIALLLSVPFGIMTMAEETEVVAYFLLPHLGDEPISEQNGSERYSVAGLKKLPAILTLCRAFDEGWIDPKAQVVCSERACRVGGPTAFLEVGETVQASELLKAAVMIAAGDAIWALMEHAFGAEDVFLQNIRLLLAEKQLDTELADCLGSEAMFSAAELVRLGETALSSENFCKYASIYLDVLRHEDGTETELVNGNRLLKEEAGCVGLLTGSSEHDGYCGVFAVTRNEMTYLLAIIGAKNSKARFTTAKELFAYAFANFDLQTLSTDGGMMQGSYPVKNGDRKCIDLVAREDRVLLWEKSRGALTVRYDLEPSLTAPLDPAEPVGNAIYSDSEGNEVCSIALYPIAAVRSNGILDIVRRIVGNFLSCASK